MKHAISIIEIENDFLKENEEIWKSYIQECFKHFKKDWAFLFYLQAQHFSCQLNSGHLEHSLLRDHQCTGNLANQLDSFTLLRPKAKLETSRDFLINE